MGTALERRIEVLEAELNNTSHVLVLMPDESGQYPDPPPEAVNIIRLQFVKATHENP